jgi:hypothetical protein
MGPASGRGGKDPERSRVKLLEQSEPKELAQAMSIGTYVQRFLTYIHKPEVSHFNLWFSFLLAGISTWVLSLVEHAMFKEAYTVLTKQPPDYIPKRIVLLWVCAAGLVAAAGWFYFAY